MWSKRDAAKPPRPGEPILAGELPRSDEPVQFAPPNASTSMPEPLGDSAALRSAPAGPDAIDAADTSSRISQTVSIHGQISGEEDLYVDGEVRGKIRFPGGKVIVGPNGRVDSDIEAREIEIHGQAQGLLRGAERVFLGRTATASGDIVARRIAIEDGASFTGRIEILRPEPEQEEPKVEVPAARAAAAGAANASPASSEDAPNAFAARGGHLDS